MAPRQLDNACVSGAEGQQCLRVAGELSKVTDAPTELDYQVAPQLSLAYCYGLTDQLTAGVTASMFGSSLDNQLLTERGGAELDSGVGVGRATCTSRKGQTRPECKPACRWATANSVVSLCVVMVLPMCNTAKARLM
ncbi:hypothetical protein [Aeromonas veronii]|uniref:hypothetical protein n=1 Tax=Aeromonas veronii TaxID=654 RepID=UPI003BA3A6DB